MLKSDICLFWSVEPRPMDWINLMLSNVGQVMIPWRWGDGRETLDTLRELHTRGKRVVLRMTEADMQIAPSTLVAQGAQYRSICALNGIILGPVEPDSAYDVTWASPDWGQQAAWTHQARIRDVMQALRALRVPLITPGHIQRKSQEGAPAVPGQVAWSDICRPVYNSDAITGNGVHLYEDNWISPIDAARFRQQIRWWSSLWHKTLWLDEVGVNHGTDVERMRAYIAMATILLTDAGSRVGFFCPFVSNGIPDGNWDAGYLLNEPQAYTELGVWMGLH